MEHFENNNELSDLLEEVGAANTERIEYYTRAYEQMRDNSDLKSIFTERIHQSQNFIAELKKYVEPPLAENFEQSNKTTKNYAGSKQKKIKKKNSYFLDNCELGEENTVRVYQDVLKSIKEIPEIVRQTLTDQQNEIKESHEFIKKFRDFNLDLTA